MKRVIEALQNSRRPLILMGAGARESAHDIINFAYKYKIPIETTWNAVDLIPHDHPLFIGRPGIIATRGANKAIQSCDLLIAIGARLDQPTVAWDYSKFAPNAVKVLVDIDTGESLKIPNLDIFIHMDAGKFINELAQNKFYVCNWIWVELYEGWKEDRLEGHTATYQLMDELSEDLPEDEIIVVNCGCMAVNIFCAGFRNKKGQRYLMSSCGLGSMGAAIPVAIGAALASGEHVTCIDGDGSFMHNIQELEVVRRLNLPITFYVMNNGGYASIRNTEMRNFGRTKRTETIPNIHDLGSVFGVEVWECIVERDEQLLPRVIVGEGSLERMYPYE